ncbi:MAG: TonB C-terminal domain-containing protein [Candidatus Aegiribacteria sp.]|nr:TonB C-terminal domain-containing protein [Candidatus Aegiribacteria sp.]
MKFTDSRHFERKSYFLRRRDVIFVIAGHVLILVVGLITSSSSVMALPGGGDAIMVNMVTLTSNEMTSSPPDIRNPAENPPEIAIEVSVPEVTENQIPDPVEDVFEEQPLDETHEESEAQDPVEASEFVSVSGEGAAGSGVPGPGTYESRVFNAVRRGYRTSVEPERSYRVILIVNPDGSSEIEVVRKSGTSAFDRAVESALSRAQIPPMPPGRNTPAIINIEFLGPE